MAQNLRQLGWAELARSASAVRQGRESDARALVTRSVSHRTPYHRDHWTGTSPWES